MAQNRHWEQDKEATIYIGNIDERATTATIYEIMLQMGPIHNIHMPRDRVTQNHQGFGFVEFRTPSDAEYAANVMNGIKLFGKSLRVNKASADKQKGADIGAELFIGNLDPMADEKLLYDTFSRFGPLLSLPKVARDDSGMSKGFGFVSFGDFESSDAAVANLDGQYMLSKEDSRLGRRRVRTTPILPTFTPAHSDLLLDHQIPQDIPWHHLLASQPHLQELRDSKHRQEQGHLGSCHRPDSNLLQASDVVELGEKEKKKINLCITRLFL
ncbi:Spliceosome-associated protein 49 [Metarhizium anisopliae]|nr:Spliceosome-associated protein 49 [Metarhizium anisopliae]